MSQHHNHLQSLMDAASNVASLSVKDAAPSNRRTPQRGPEHMVQIKDQVQQVLELSKKCTARSDGAFMNLLKDVESMEAVDRDALSVALDKAVKELSKSTKSLHSGVSSLAKLIESKSGDVGSGLKVVYNQVLFGKEEGESREDALRDLDALLVEHMYVQGEFERGDILAKEAGVVNWEEIKKPYVELCRIEKELMEHRLEEAMAWVDAHADILQQNVRYAGNHLAFLLHRLYFLQVLQHQGEYAAIEYAKRNLQGFYRTHTADLHQLLGGLAMYRQLHKPSCHVDGHVWQRYGMLYGHHGSNDFFWDEVRREFRRQFCFVIGKPQDSPLMVTASAGAHVLPTLLKYAKVAAKTKSTGAFSASDQLPVELTLPDAFAFHSTFTCPVSKESNTPEDPAHILPCGHCLNKNSILKIAKSPARRFKCPYCPSEATFAECQELHFVI